MIVVSIAMNTHVIVTEYLWSVGASVFEEKPLGFEDDHKKRPTHPNLSAQEGLQEGEDAVADLIGVAELFVEIHVFFSQWFLQSLMNLSVGRKAASYEKWSIWLLGSNF